MAASNKERIRAYLPSGLEELQESRKSVKERVKAYQPAVLDDLLEESKGLSASLRLHSFPVGHDFHDNIVVVRVREREREECAGGLRRFTTQSTERRTCMHLGAY